MRTIDIFGMLPNAGWNRSVLGQVTPEQLTTGELPAPTNLKKPGAIVNRLKMPRPLGPPQPTHCNRLPFRWHKLLPAGLRPIRLEDGRLTCFQFLRCHSGGQHWEYVYEMATCHPNVEKVMSPAPTVTPEKCTPSQGSWIVKMADGSFKCYQVHICSAGSEKWEIVKEIPCPTTPTPPAPPAPTPVIVGTGVSLVPVQATPEPLPENAPVPAAPPQATPAQTQAAEASGAPTAAPVPSGGISPLAVAGGVGAAGLAALLATGVIKI